jgi:hypothetical protein
MLARFERLVEQAVEGSLRRVFPTPLQPVQVAKAAARAMEQAQVVGVYGREVPNHYELRLASADFERFGDYAAPLARQVSQYLVEYARERGLRPVAEPRVELVADRMLSTGSVRALARFVDLAPAVQREVDGAVEDTRRLRLGELAAAQSSRVTQAQLGLALVEDESGLRFALEPQPGIVRLGRAPDNDVVIASRRVSRYHAQLRWVELRWLVYDLDSTNGTWLDGERVLATQPRTLEPGVRLRLGDYALEVRAEEDASGRA